MKPCETEGCVALAISRERFCKKCRKARLQALRECGYLTEHPDFSHRYRPYFAREDTQETKRGVER